MHSRRSIEPRLGRFEQVFGFTLVELLVVILVLAVLIAVAAPSFLGQTEKAHESVAKQYLAVVYKAAKAEAASNENDYGQFPPASVLAPLLQQSEPQLEIVAGSCPEDATTDPKRVVVDEDFTGGGDLKICNDPERKIYFLTVDDHSAPVYSDLPASQLYAAVVVKDDPAAYWRFSEGSGTAVADSSGNGNGLTLNSSVTRVAGLVGDGGAVRFNGTNGAGSNYFTALSSPTWSFETWFEVKTAGSFFLGFNRGTWSGTYWHGWFLNADYSGGNLYFPFADAQSHPIQLNQVYHIVATYDGTTQRLYRDGVLLSSKTVSMVPKDTTSGMTITCPGSLCLDGVVDEVAVYDYALPADRVAAHYSAKE